MRILLILSLLVLTACGATAPPAAAPPTPLPPRIGQDLMVGAIRWRVDSVKDGGKEMSANGHTDRTEWGFVVIETTITNTGPSTIKIVPPVLYTSTHVDIKASGSQELILLNDRECGYSDLGPNETRPCRFIYELRPDGGTAARLEVSDFQERSPQGLFIELQ